MKQIKCLLRKLYHLSWLKYAVVTIVAVLFIGFIDENSAWNHYRNTQRIDDLQEEIDQYVSQYNHDNMRIHQLDKDPKAIEKIARERYFMKTDDEDIFVLSDDEPFVSQGDDENIE